MSQGGILQPRRRRLNDQTGAQSGFSTQQAPGQRVAPQTRQLSQAEWNARRQRRTADMLEALQQIDTAPSMQAQRDIVQWLKEVYEARGGGDLVGLFGHCYLGPPYIDHAFSMMGDIMDHYAPSDAVPAVYQPARPYAMSQSYQYIEIYADGQVVPIRPDGSAVV